MASLSDMLRGDGGPGTLMSTTKRVNQGNKEEAQSPHASDWDSLEQSGNPWRKKPRQVSSFKHQLGLNAELLLAGC